jgi:3-(3-hydroxy-phenyl)propionate hydroxylase
MAFGDRDTRMPATHQSPRYAPAPRPPDGQRHPVVVAGGGLVGLTLALDLARHGVAVVLLDEDDTVSAGSRAICFAKRTLEIYGRLGLGRRFLEKGITWKTGRVFHRDREAYRFDLLPEEGHEYPAFVNLQQYYAEEWLVEACAAAGVDLRWKHRIAGIEPREDGTTLRVETPEGAYALHAAWLLACDGARSFVRESLGLPFTGQVFRDRFLIADVVIRGEVGFPPERWFWFDPPFHPGQSVLLHKQPDDVWRIDFQLGWDADPEAEKQPERVTARVRAMLGPEVPFELEWVSVYTFRCRRLERFRHGRVIFAGDSAHQVSPFGARGGNSGVQDADNLAWKLAAVLAGRAPESLLDSYEAERIEAAEENIRHSTRSTDFITPKSDAARGYRDAVLELAARHEFARPLVNSGRLSRPTLHAASPLNGADDWQGGAAPGTPAPDAPVLRAGAPDWLLRHVGDGFRLLVFAAPDPTLAARLPHGVLPVFVSAEEAPGALWDHAGLAAARFAAPRGGAVLLRPDQLVAARLAAPDPARIAAALDTALGRRG